MAVLAGDTEFQKRCGDLYTKGSKNIAALFNGEYYVQIEDPDHPEGCILQTD